MIYCANCGQGCPDTAKFCPACGTKLIKDVQPAETKKEESVAAVIEEEIAAQPANEVAETPAEVPAEAPVEISEEPCAPEEPHEEPCSVAEEPCAPAEPCVSEEIPEEEPCAPAEELAPATDGPQSGPAPVGDTAAQQNVLNSMYRFLKYRRLACNIGGIYMLILSLIFLVVGAILSAVGIVSLLTHSSAYASGFSLGYGITWFIIGIIYLPIAIVNFVMKRKANNLMNEMYSNIRPAADYSRSIGQIVLAYFFNTVAMVFAIIGCVITRKNSALIDEIEHNQKLSV